MISSKTFKTFSVLVLLSLCASGARAAVEKQNAVVEKALTGDTIRLKSGSTLRYIGVDAYSPQGKDLLARGYGEKARDFNESLVGGKEVLVEWDAKIRDEHNNFLGYVYLPDGRFVNLEIVKAGWAKARIRVPNTKYAAALRDGEEEARRDVRGLWENEPKDRFGNKRYVGEKNTKIYYRPDSPELARIPEAQLIYFDTRVDAKAAGYRACGTCKEQSASEFEQ